MRIVHVSDLHFGAHNEALTTSLKDGVEDLKPDLIVATGDLVDNPGFESFQLAREFLLGKEGLETKCRPQPKDDPNRPRLFVVPGNHDVRYLGNVRVSSRLFRQTFSHLPTHYYFQPENIWIYGFDSSEELRIGANGMVSADAIRTFVHTHHELSQNHGEKFRFALKIAIIHHHPLPIQYDPTHQRWLSLINAGEFLGEILEREIDLVLHGHEHVQARASYERRLRGTPDPRRVQVISVGSALKANPGKESNRFNVITIEDGEIRLDAYGAEGNAFGEQPWESYQLRSSSERQSESFDQWTSESGFYYDGVMSLTVLYEDGDGHRVVDCDDFTLLDANKPSAESVNVAFPETSGYVDLPSGSPLQGGLMGLEFVPNTSDDESKAVVKFGRKLREGEKINYRYQWWTVNAFAMDDQQFRLKYGTGRPPVEFTHIPVTSPIRDLTIVVKFPNNFRLQDKPEVFVGKSNRKNGELLWIRDGRIETELAQQKALRYVPALQTVALRVSRPERGYSYGIQWRVPESEPLMVTSETTQLEDLVDVLLRLRQNLGEDQKVFFSQFLGASAGLLRERLINTWNEWDESLEMSLMVYDSDRRKMVVIAAANIGIREEQIVWVDHSFVEFDYGEGIGGKVFKTNEYRLYKRIPEEAREAPDFYRPVEGQPSHAVLLSIPLQNPNYEKHVWGVLNCGSSSARCPLHKIGEPGVPVKLKELRDLQSAINQVSFESLTTQFL